MDILPIRDSAPLEVYISLYHDSISESTRVALSSDKRLIFMSLGSVTLGSDGLTADVGVSLLFDPGLTYKATDLLLISCHLMC